MVAAAIIGAGVISAGAGMYGASKASDAASDAANLQNQRYQTTRGDLQPYFQPGYNALSDMSALTSLGRYGGGPDYVGMAQANMPGQMTQAELEQTPGYQFDRSQGLKAVQSAAAARGLGVSGASLKGAGTFATGLANKTYLDQFNVGQQRFTDYLNLNTGQQANLQGQYGRLSGIATLGANAAAQVGTQGTTLANQQANYINQAGLADASGIQGIGKAVSGTTNNLIGYNQYQNQTNPLTTNYNAGYQAGAFSNQPAGTYGPYQ